MQKQIFYTYKFKSSRLAEFNYEIKDLDFEQAKKNKEVISMFDSQLLRSIRRIKDKEFSYKYLNELKSEIEILRKEDYSEENEKKLKGLKKKINDLLFVPEIISIVIENKSHYKYLFNNNLKVNGSTYRRFSSSAGQARNSVVIFCEIKMADKLDIILDNGRDTDKKLVPSKFNAYKGLVTSSSSTVTTPKFCVVPDYESKKEVKVNFVTEAPLHEDDHIDVRTITEKFNRFDGQGLISIELATKWAEDLGLDYIPSQWCIRQNYLKGMLSTFDIKSFCKLKNNGNYMIETSYKDEHGNPKLANLQEVDVIISESQLKLWSSWSSVEEYEENCKKNNLTWGVTLVSPKQDKDVLKMNYQFLQTLLLTKSDIEEVCSMFVDWITGVTSKDIYYTLLFLLGTEINEDKIINYINESDNHWVKVLMLDHSLIHDKWIKKKIYDLIKNKIKKGCLGQILADGNFQVLVSDPYAMMEHVCGLEVKGLLGEKEFYSNYWNKKGVKVVDSMRAPLTYRSEHVLLNLKQNEEVDYWYKYNTTGIIVNVHGHETMNWAGSDFDMDIIATTSDKTIIKGVYQNELPVAYNPPKPKPEKLTERKLYNADIHSFGSEIGQITNKSTSGFALLAQLDENSEEYNVTMNRIKMCTKLQSAQIDKAKIGRKVKSIPKIWMKYNHINEDDSQEIKNNKELLNKTLLHKHPYFFTYLYKNTRQKYKNYYNNQDVTCRQKFGISIDDLNKLNRKTTEQLEFLKKFKHYSPVIDSDCVMNNLCRYIESIDFGIRNVMKQDDDDKLHTILMNNPLIEIDQNKYKQLKKGFKEFKRLSASLAASKVNDMVKSEFDEDLENVIATTYDSLKESLYSICRNQVELVDYLIYMYYVDKSETNKEVLWSNFGDQIVENIKRRSDKLVIPIPSHDGEISYLNKKYTLKEVDLINE